MERQIFPQKNFPFIFLMAFFATLWFLSFSAGPSERDIFVTVLLTLCLGSFILLTFWTMSMNAGKIETDSKGVTGRENLSDDKIKPYGKVITIAWPDVSVLKTRRRGFIKKTYEVLSKNDEKISFNSWTTKNCQDLISVVKNYTEMKFQEG